MLILVRIQVYLEIGSPWEKWDWIRLGQVGLGLIGMGESLDRFLIGGDKRIALGDMVVLLVAIDKVRRTVYY